jgi:hypothetical protein
MLRLAGIYGDLFNVTSQTAKGEEVSEEQVLKDRDYVFDVARKFNRYSKVAYAMDLRRNQYDQNQYAEDIESAIEKGARFLVTYFPRDKNYIECMKNFAEEIMPSFT